MAETNLIVGVPQGVDQPSDGGVSSAIEVVGISKVYGEAQRSIAALNEISFAVEASDFVSVIGPSGCGKTTLLKIIGDVLDPSTGHVDIGGRSASLLRRERRIGFVFQSPVLFPWRTVRENVALPFEIARPRGRFRRLPSDQRDRVVEVLTTVGLEDFADRLPSELSGGMQSRVSLARALVREPEVLLMDEPFAALDELTRTDMALHLLDVWERVRTTVVFVTHHIHEAVLLSNRILVMSQRPGVIRRDIKVEVSRPRSLESRRDRLFAQIVEELTMDFHTHGRE